MKKVAVLLFSFPLFASGINPPPEWEKGFWVGYEAGKHELERKADLMKEILFVKEQILQSKIPPIVIEGNKCKIVDKRLLDLWRKKEGKSLPSGWYVVVDTSNLTTAQKYYLYSLLRDRYRVYDKGSLWVGVFPSEKDAKVVNKELEKKYGVEAFISQVN
jgi:hypothetical protein